MWKNSNELFDDAIRKLQSAVEKGEREVKIILTEYCRNDFKSIKKFANNLGIRTITETLRRKFANYEIKSEVSIKKNFSFVLSYMNKPCNIYYPLVWTLTIEKKEA